MGYGSWAAGKEIVSEVTRDQEPENNDLIQKALRSFTVSCDEAMLAVNTLL